MRLLAAALVLLAAQESAKDQLRARYGERFRDLDDDAAARTLDAEKTIGAYLAAESSERRGELAARLKDVPLATVEHLLRCGGTGFTPAKAGSRIRTKTTLKRQDDSIEVELQVTVPGDYDPTAVENGVPKRWPLVIGAGNYLIKPEENCFGVQLPYPDLPGGYGRGSHSQKLLQQVVRETSAIYPIDADRVFLTGASAMGHCCWYTAMAYPDLPAGIYTGASMPFPSILNQGRKDEEVVLPPLGQVRAIANYWEYSPDDEGHNPRKYMEPVLKRIAELKYDDLTAATKGEELTLAQFMKGRRRAAMPVRVLLESDEKRINRNWWIEVVDFAPRATFVLQILCEDEKVERRTLFKKPVIVDAAADRQANRITIKADGAKRLRVYLAGALVDFDREIQIVVNDKTTKHTVKPTVAKMLDATRRTGNRTIPYAAFVEVDVP